jgi:hypothetical protein
MPLSDRPRKCDLGSPVREICTPGSEWGDGYKVPCRLGDAPVSKGTARPGSAKANAPRPVPTSHNLDHELVLRAVRKYTQCSWILLYLKRWLEAPAQLEDGTLVPRTKGTPQGGVVSPLVANIFLHLAFDDWMRRVHPDVPFERYADDSAPRRRGEEAVM